MNQQYTRYPSQFNNKGGFQLPKNQSSKNNNLKSQSANYLSGSKILLAKKRMDLAVNTTSLICGYYIFNLREVDLKHARIFI
jgi:hypothetical protein